MRLNPVVSSLAGSLTAEMDVRVREMKARGIEVVNLGVGQPDFETPAAVRRAVAEAVEAGHTKYTPPMGYPELREAAAGWLADITGVPYRAEEVLVSNGSKHAIHTALLCLAGPGDEVVIPAPYWVSYPELVRLTGATPVIASSSEETGFRLTAAALRAAVTPRTRAVILNTPSNPTGAVYGRKDLEALLEVVRERDLAVIADEIYAQLVYDGAVHVSFASLGEEARERTVTVNGVSKSFSMTGFRIGFAAGPAATIRAMGIVQGQETGCPGAAAQRASIAAIRSAGGAVREMRDAYARRRALGLEILSGIPGLRVHPPDGAFYFFPDVSAFYGRRGPDGPVAGSASLAAYLLTRGVATVPGEGFGSDRHIRIAFAVGDRELAAGLAAVRSGLAALA